MELQEYKPSDVLRSVPTYNAHLSNKVTNAKHKLASRQVIFTDLSDDHISTGENKWEKARSSSRQLNLQCEPKVDVDRVTTMVEPNLQPNRTFDLREQVEDLSAQLEELNRITRGCLTHPRECFCQDCKRSPPSANQSSRPRDTVPATPPLVNLTEPTDCCVSCLVPCALKANQQTSGMDLDWNSSQINHLQDRQYSLQNQLSQMNERLTAMQDRCTTKDTTVGLVPSREMDVDEHLARRARSHSIRLNDMTEERATTKLNASKPRLVRSPNDTKKTPCKRTPLHEKPFVIGTVQSTGRRSGPPNTRLNRPDKSPNRADLKRAYDIVDGDAERTLAELASRLCSSQAALDSRLCDIKTSSQPDKSGEQDQLELKQLATQLCSIQSELRDQLAGIQLLASVLYASHFLDISESVHIAPNFCAAEQPFS
ncbi:hypothetical protein P879_03644 [Paragonimus westermani]|uniref:Uncharacterized protein n=1 Tax=Paragonimus westermani TaxID=34504 RepID=A0A8T0DNY0_9TREM|nr:hypothetical protein P879_03644 [Paragonimus westermani]